MLVGVPMDKFDLEDDDCNPIPTDIGTRVTHSSFIRIRIYKAQN